MTREELDFIGSMNMCDEISDEAYKKIVCHCREQEPSGDAVNREAILLEIDKIKDNYGGLLDVAMFIRALPSVNPQPEWIDVGKRLPEKYGEYLITWTTSQSKRPFIGISEGEVTGEYDHEHNRFKFEWLLEDYIKAYPNVEVIAWMPLPNPYEP